MHLKILPHTVWRGTLPRECDFEKEVAGKMPYGLEEDEGCNRSFYIRRANMDEAEEEFKTHDIYVALQRFFNAHPLVNTVELT